MKELLEEGVMHKDIMIQSIRDCPILKSSISQETVYMPLITNLAVIILLLQLPPPNLKKLNSCLQIMQMSLSFGPFTNSGLVLKKPN